MKKTKLILLTLIILLVTILLNTMEVQATLQANQIHIIKGLIDQQIG